MLLRFTGFEGDVGAAMYYVKHILTVDKHILLGWISLPVHVTDALMLLKR